MVTPAPTIRNSSADDVRTFLDLVRLDGTALELRALGLPGGVVAGWFDEMGQAAEAVHRLDGQRPSGVYVTLNPIDRNLLARRANRIGPTRHGPSLTGDNSVVARRWLPLDFDPERPEGISASEEEHRAALERAEAVADWLAELGWPEPVRADSGNGAHVLYRTDLPNNQASGVLVRRCLEAIAARFGGDGVIVDTSVFNASRIWKVYGTIARKGEDLPERPHRRASILAVPPRLEVVPRYLLDALAGEAPEDAAPVGRRDSHRSFDVDAFLTRHGLTATAGPWQSGGRRWRLARCPFSDTHTDGAYVVQLPNGAIAGGCHHNSCMWTWRELREHLEPSASPRPAVAPAPQGDNTPVRLADLHDGGGVASTALLPAGVWRGFFADFRRWVEPTTDGAFETMFVGAAVAMGLALGRRSSVSYGRVLYPNTFGLIVGPSGSVRKTTVVSRVKAAVTSAFGDQVRVTQSIGSGEGLLELFCKDEGDRLTPIPGQRVLLVEAEFTNMLTKMGRSGTANILDILMALYDGEDYTPNTRHRPIAVREPFLSVIATTTPENLQGRLEPRYVDAGFLPRCTLFFASRREPIAYPELPDAQGLEALAERLKRLGRRRRHTYSLSTGARELWTTLYARYRDVELMASGTVGHMATRIPEHTMHFALLYAADAGHTSIQVDDLEAAALVGDYLLGTAAYLPDLHGTSRESDVERRIVRALGQTNDFVPASRIHHLVSGRIDAARLRRALEALVALGVVERRKVPVQNHGDVLAYRLRENPLSRGHAVSEP